MHRRIPTACCSNVFSTLNVLSPTSTIRWYRRGLRMARSHYPRGTSHPERLSVVPVRMRCRRTLRDG
jgi:hypothetical protein